MLFVFIRFATLHIVVIVPFHIKLIWSMKYY